jgi:hypothetical protein
MIAEQLENILMKIEQVKRSIKGFKKSKGER